jgi:hypothetical protein
MFRYAQINIETGMVICVSELSGKVDAADMIPIENAGDVFNKKYVNGQWFDIEKEEAEPTENELIQAEILLNQAEIISKQKEHDEILAELLLGQQ